MTTSVKDLRNAIAVAIGTIDGLRAQPYLTDQVNAPQANVYRRQSVYDDVMQSPGEDAPRTYLLGIVVYAGRINERVGQDFLDDLADASSIKATVETDVDLKAICDYVLVTQPGEVSVRTIGVIDYLTEEYTVEIAVS